MITISNEPAIIPIYIKSVADKVTRAVKKNCKEGKCDTACDVMIEYYDCITTIYNQFVKYLVIRYIVDANYLMSNLYNVDSDTLHQLIIKCYEVCDYYNRHYCKIQKGYENVNNEYVTGLLKRCAHTEKRIGYYVDYMNNFNKYLVKHSSDREVLEHLEDVIKMGNVEVKKGNIEDAFPYYYYVFCKSNVDYNHTSMLDILFNQSSKHDELSYFAKILVIFDKLKAAGTCQLNLTLDHISSTIVQHIGQSVEKYNTNDYKKTYNIINQYNVKLSDHIYWLVVENLIQKYMLQSNTNDAEIIFQDVVDKYIIEKAGYLIDLNVTKMIYKIGIELAEYYIHNKKYYEAIEIYEKLIDCKDDDEMMDKIVLLKVKVSQA